jgi:tRNA dimethylallyltransferase
MRACLTGALGPAEALAATVRATRQLAKRQRTWFRREATIVWRHPEEERAGVRAEVRAFVIAGERPAAA